MDKALNYMGLARKAGRIELGEEPAGAAARALRACLIVVACDASDHTWRRAKSFVAGTRQLCIRVPFTKDQLGMAIGRTSLALAAFTDPALALAFVKTLGDPEKYRAEHDALEAVCKRPDAKRRQSRRQGNSRPAAKKEH